MPIPYICCLLILAGLAGLLRNRQMLWVAAMLLLNWGACAWLGLADETGTNWLVNSFIDFATACLILCVPIERGQVAVASFYVPMMMCHFWLGWQGHGNENDRIYLTALGGLAWFQAAMLFLWGAKNGTEMAGLSARGIWDAISRHAPDRGPTSYKEEG